MTSIISRRRAGHALLAGGTSLVLMCALVGTSDAHLCIIRQGPESDGAAEAGDRYGGAVATGDFNGDGFEDLAAAATGEDEDIIGSHEHGAVIVSYGSRHGVTHANADYVSVGAPDDNLVRFGTAIGVGDFNDDGRDDLAIGAPMADIDFVADTGLIGIVYGQPSGVGANPSVFLDERDAGGAIEAGDYFGYAVACADFNGDGYDDVAVGSYGEDSSAGAISYFYGGPSGITTTGAGWMKQSSLGYASTAGDWFGWSLAAGNVTGSSHADLIVGAPRKPVGSHSQAGQVYVIKGGASGLTTSGPLMMNASTLGVGFTTADHFGYSLAVGRLYETSGPLDLVIGEPRFDVTGATDAGRIVVVEFDTGTPAGPSPKTFLQSDLGSPVTETNDQFGFALAAGDWNADGYDDIAIGSPYEDIGSTDGAGFVQILMGGAGGPGAHGVLGYTATNLNDTPRAGDNLGRAVCFGRFDDTQRANLAIGAPGKDFESVYPPGTAPIDAAGSVFIAAPWRQVQSVISWSSISVDCEGSIIFSQKMFDRVRMASTTKAMTLLLASQWSKPTHPGYHAAYTALSSIYTVPSWVANNIGGSQANLLTAQRMNLIGLMRAMMTVSGNDAAYAIADLTTGAGHPWAGYVGTVQTFVDSMNVRATQLGMYRTHFTTPKGSNDDEPGFPETPGTQGAHTTAYDFALLARAVMQDSLARSIVGTEGWSVPSQKWMNGGYVYANDYYPNGFFKSVKNRLGDLAAGVKGGNTPEAKVTGLFAAAADSFIYGPSIVTSFRNASGGTMHNQAKDLMLLALDDCVAPGTIVLPPPPPWEPHDFVLPDIPACGDSLWGGAFELANDAPDSLDIELLAKRLDAGPASATIHTWRNESVMIQSAGMADFSFGPLDGHDGIEVRNTGHSAAVILATYTGQSSPVTLNLAAGATRTTPSYIPVPGGPATYVLHLASASADPIELEVGIRDWQRRVTLSEVGTGIPGGPLHAGRRLLSAEASSREWCFWVEGHDRACGGVLTLTVQDFGQSATGVETASNEIVRPSPGAVLLTGSPNPFSPAAGATRIRYAIGDTGTVRLEIFDVAGRLVRRLLDGELQAAGMHVVHWDGSDDGGRPLAPGVYFARLEAEGHTRSTRLVLMK